MEMKHKTLLLATAVLASVSLGYAAMPPAPNYCEHMGYNYSNNACHFNQNSSCSGQAFLNGSCGQEYVKNISCREKGEFVFTEFESCCEDLKPYVDPGAIGQPVCQPEKSVLQKITNHLDFLIQLLLEIVRG